MEDENKVDEAVDEKEGAVDESPATTDAELNPATATDEAVEDSADEQSDEETTE
jgi:hypothetical protein